MSGKSFSLIRFFNFAALKDWQLPEFDNYAAEDANNTEQFHRSKNRAERHLLLLSLYVYDVLSLSLCGV
jgi:hypothetical protein